MPEAIAIVLLTQQLKQRIELFIELLVRYIFSIWNWSSDWSYCCFDCARWFAERRGPLGTPCGSILSERLRPESSDPEIRAKIVEAEARYDLLVSFFPRFSFVHQTLLDSYTYGWVRRLISHKWGRSSPVLANKSMPVVAHRSVIHTLVGFFELSVT